MKPTIQALMALALAAGLALPGLGEPLESTRYEVRIALDPTTQTLVGTQRVDVVNDEDAPISQAIFALMANAGAEPNPYLHPALLDSQRVRGFDPSWTRIYRVADADGEPLSFALKPAPPSLQTYSLEDGLLLVDLPTPLAPGERFVISIDFETGVPEALLPDACVYRGTYVWRFGWHPMLVSPSVLQQEVVFPAAQYRVELTVPEQYVVVGGADRQDVVSRQAGLTTYELSNDGAARSIPLVIGEELDTVATSWNDIELEAAYLPGGESFARLALSHVSDILAFYTDRYGPLDARRLVIVESPIPGFFGMAADGMIVVGRSAVRLRNMPALGTYDRLIEYLLAHELAHLWWGIGVGADFNAENWISEGFAEYLSIGYFESTHGAFGPNLFDHLEGGLIEDALRSELGDLNLRQHLSEAPYIDLLRLDFDEAIVKPLGDVDYLNGLVVRTYNKGYLVLRALASLLGEEQMQSILAEASDRWRGRRLTVEQFRTFAEAEAGVDLSLFFANWVHGAARLDVAVQGFDVIETDAGYETAVRLVRRGADLPVEILATTADGTDIRHTWSGTSPAGTLRLQSSSPIVAIHVDPEERLPDANRFDNHAPRRILIDHPFRGGDAPPIGRPLDAYVLDILPTGIAGSFRNDHRWNLTAMPHLDPYATRVDFNELLSSWDVIGLFTADLDRSLSLTATAVVTGLDVARGIGELDARMTVHQRWFTHPETGTPGTYWYPTTRTALTVGLRGDLPTPIPYLAATVTRSDLLTAYLDNTLTVQIGIPGFETPSFATAAGSTSKRFRFAPFVYLDGELSAAGSLFHDPPAEFLFSMDRLHAFPGPPHGLYQLFGRAELTLPPLLRDAGYAVFNLTRIEDVIASGFIQGGRTWGGCDRICEPGVRLEAGAKLTLRVDALLGTTLELSLGYAHPLLGPDGVGAPFVDIALPL